MNRVFLDSSVLFSAAYSSRGHSRDLILMAIREETILVTSQLVLTETRRNLTEAAPDKLHYLEYALANIPWEFIRPTKGEVLSAAERVVLKDAPILAAARKAKVKMLVTLDRKHLLGKPELSTYLGAPIVTPKDAIIELHKTGKP